LGLEALKLHRYYLLSLFTIGIVVFIILVSMIIVQ
jgi:hypothetical protein